MLIPNIAEVSKYFMDHDIFGKYHAKWVSDTIDSLLQINPAIVPIIDNLRVLFSPGITFNESRLYIGLFAFWRMLDNAFMVRYQICQMTNSLMSEKFYIDNSIVSDILQESIELANTPNIPMSLAGRNLTSLFATAIYPEMSCIKDCIKNGTLHNSQYGLVPYLLVYDFTSKKAKSKLISKSTYISVEQETSNSIKKQLVHF